MRAHAVKNQRRGARLYQYLLLPLLSMTSCLCPHLHASAPGGGFALRAQYRGEQRTNPRQVEGLRGRAGKGMGKRNKCGSCINLRDRTCGGTNPWLCPQRAGQGRGTASLPFLSSLGDMAPAHTEVSLCHGRTGWGCRRGWSSVPAQARRTWHFQLTPLMDSFLTSS